MELPELTQTALTGLRRVEDAAAGQQVRTARVVTGRLLQALVGAGWPVSVLVAPMGRTGVAIRQRIARMPIPQAPLGVDIPLPPVAPRRIDPRAIPLDQRQWLRPKEAAELLAVHHHTLTRWRRAGLLPRTTKRSNNTHLFHRDDLLAVVRLRAGRKQVPGRTLIDHVDADAGLRNHGTWPSQGTRQQL